MRYHGEPGNYLWHATTCLRYRVHTRVRRLFPPISRVSPPFSVVAPRVASRRFVSFRFVFRLVGERAIAHAPIRTFQPPRRASELLSLRHRYSPCWRVLTIWERSINFLECDKRNISLVTRPCRIVNEFYIIWVLIQKIRNLNARFVKFTISDHLASRIELWIFNFPPLKKIRTNNRCLAINYIFRNDSRGSSIDNRSKNRKERAPNLRVYNFRTSRSSGSRLPRNNRRIAGYIADNPPFWSKATGSPIIAGAACASSRKKAARERWRWRWRWLWRPSVTV